MCSRGMEALVREWPTRIFGKHPGFAPRILSGGGGCQDGCCWAVRSARVLHVFLLNSYFVYDSTESRGSYSEVRI